MTIASVSQSVSQSVMYGISIVGCREAGALPHRPKAQGKHLDSFSYH